MCPLASMSCLCGGTAVNFCRRGRRRRGVRRHVQECASFAVEASTSLEMAARRRCGHLQVKSSQVTCQVKSSGNIEIYGRQMCMVLEQRVLTESRLIQSPRPLRANVRHSAMQPQHGTRLRRERSEKTPARVRMNDDIMYNTGIKLYNMYINNGVSRIVP